PAAAALRPGAARLLRGGGGGDAGDRAGLLEAGRGRRPSRHPGVRDLRLRVRGAGAAGDAAQPDVAPCRPRHFHFGGVRPPLLHLLPPPPLLLPRRPRRALALCRLGRFRLGRGPPPPADGATAGACRRRRGGARLLADRGRERGLLETAIPPARGRRAAGEYGLTSAGNPLGNLL